MKVTIKNLQKKIPITPSISAKVKRTILKACSIKGLKKSGEITVCFVDNQDIRELNLQYLGRPSPTDVIVFDLSEGNNLLADIVISTERAVSNARVFKTAPLYELYLYAAHGILHLLGYDDKNPRQRKIMHKKAISILDKLNILGTIK